MRKAAFRLSCALTVLAALSCIDGGAKSFAAVVVGIVVSYALCDSDAS